MSMLLAAGCGALGVGGVVAVVHGLRRTRGGDRPPDTLATAWARVTRKPAGRRGRTRDRLLLAGLAAGLVAYLITGWGLWLVVLPLGFVAVPFLLADPPNSDIEMLSALDRWVRGMAASLQVGQSIADALRLSARNPPAVIAEQVRLMTARLENRWPVAEALLGMADGLDTPDADAVLAALSLAAQRGGTGATATLQALSESVQERLRALRDIEAERAKPRVVVRQVSLISLVVLGLALVVGRDFFAPYRTPLGQLILLALVGAYLASLLAMRRITAPPRRARIFQVRR